MEKSKPKVKVKPLTLIRQTNEPKLLKIIKAKPSMEKQKKRCLNQNFIYMNSIYKMVFSEDLKFGQIYEDKYQKRMIECFGKLVEKAPNKIFKDYDYIFENGSVEVKADRMVEKTGNFL